MSDDVRRAADIVCLADNRRPHVLARVTIAPGGVPDLILTPGIQWFTSETSGGSSVHFTCKHGPSMVDLSDLHREMRSTRRRVRRTVNAKHSA